MRPFHVGTTWCIIGSITTSCRLTIPTSLLLTPQHSYCLRNYNSKNMIQVSRIRGSQCLVPFPLFLQHEWHWAAKEIHPIPRPVVTKCQEVCTITQNKRMNWEKFSIAPIKKWNQVMWHFNTYKAKSTPTYKRRGSHILERK